MKAYSNPADHVERLRSLLDLPRDRRRDGPRWASKQAQKRLGADEAAELVEAYRAGDRMTQLARRFGVHRQTVRDLLVREGVHRPLGIQPDYLPEITRFYEEGWSLLRLASAFDVSPSGLNNALRKAGVTIRPPGRPRRGQAHL